MTRTKLFIYNIQMNKVAMMNKCTSFACHLMAMAMCRCDAERIAQYSRSMCRHHANICPILPRRTPSSCGFVKSHSEASVQKAPNGLSTQLIKTSCCVERLNFTIGDDELSNFSSYQTANHQRSLSKGGRSWPSTAVKLLMKYVLAQNGWDCDFSGF